MNYFQLNSATLVNKIMAASPDKNSIKIIGGATDKYCQAYFAYDSKKSGGVTRMHLRFGKEPIRSTYLVNHPHFVSCSKDSYLTQYDMIEGIREGGASAVLAASIFHYGIFTIKEAKNYLHANKIPVRI